MSDKCAGETATDHDAKGRRLFTDFKKCSAILKARLKSLNIDMKTVE